MIEILKYLLESYLVKETDDKSKDAVDDDLLMTRLEDEAELNAQIYDAIDSLQLEDVQEPIIHINVSKLPSIQQSARIFTETEKTKLGTRGHGLLLQLEQARMITPNTRELILNYAMALKTEHLDIRQVKLLVFVIMYQQSGCSSPEQWLTELALQVQSSMH